MATIVIAGITLTTPGNLNPVPLPQRVARIKVYWMRRGATGAGQRCLRLLGSHVSHGDFRFRLSYLTPSQFATLQNLHDNQETFTFSVNGTNYTCIFAEGGFQPSVPRWTEPSQFLQAQVVLHILSQG
ncbi:MAG: hypothetical protein ACH37Z_11490 [Anaerolineae bacterium]